MTDEHQLPSEERGVGGKGPGEPELLPHENAEEPLRQGLGIRSGPWHAGTKQNFPSGRRRKIQRSFSVIWNCNAFFIHRSQQSGLHTPSRKVQLHTASYNKNTQMNAVHLSSSTLSAQIRTYMKEKKAHSVRLKWDYWACRLTIHSTDRQLSRVSKRVFVTSQRFIICPWSQ